MTGYELTQASILIVEDQPANIALLESCLAEEGFGNVTSMTDPRHVLPRFEEVRPDLILLDLHMPYLDGFSVLQQLRERVPDEDFLPILVLTADITSTAKQRALAGGATDFLTKPLDLVEVTLRIRNLLKTRFLHREQRIARRMAEVAQQAAEAAERRATFLAEASKLLFSSLDYQTTISSLCRAVVPQLADYCVVEEMTEDGRISRVGIAHADASKEALLRESSHSQSGVLPREHPTMAALIEGRRTLAQEITREMMEAVAANEEHLWIMEQLHPRSLIVVPVTDSRRILGALVLARSESESRYELDDLALAEELARRAGWAIENARLFNEAQQATEARDELLAVVAHDLRNPLNTITMAVSLVIEEIANASQRRHLEIAHRSAQQMNRLIEDLLEVSRIERGMLRIEPLPDRVPRLVREAVDMLMPIATARRLTLEAELIDELPQVVMDGARILQVISNLVGNAVKFTPEGGRIRILCEPVGDEVRFAIADTGHGIPREQIPHIFGRFWQASDRDSRGIGLGLAIARGIVEAHRGQIWVESEVGVGTTFYFTLPQARS